MVRIAHLGSPGSFTEEAALTWCSRGRLDLDPQLLGHEDPRAVVELVRSGAAEVGVLPIANSTGGPVQPCLDALDGSGFRPLEVIALAVRFTLFCRAGGIEIADLRAVASHPQAFRQCARSLERLLPERAQLERSDTASAARDLAEGLLTPDVAVLASRRAGAARGLHPLAIDVQDDPDNRTFFLLFQIDHP
jgi:prephenate dehydratase